MKTPSSNSVEAALVALAASDNGAGFKNPKDRQFGTSLVRQLLHDKDLSDKQRFAAWQMLAKYKDQLLRTWSIDYTSIPQPPKPAPSAPSNATKVVDVQGGVFAFTFPYSTQLKDALKEQVPGRRWNPDAKRWEAPLSAAKAVGKFALANTFFVSDAAYGVLEGTRDLPKQNKETIAESNATDGDIEVKGLAKVLRPFQRGGVAYALKYLKPQKGILCGDEMGLGKTPQSLAVIHVKQAFPSLVAVPRVVWLKWAKEIQQWLPNQYSVVLLGGRIVTRRSKNLAQTFDATIVKMGEPLPKADFYIIKYSVFYKWTEPLSKALKKNSKKKTHTATGPLKDIAFESVIFDESHYLKEDTSQRTIAAEAFVNTVTPDVRLALSGTPIPNRHKELLTILRLLNRVEDICPGGEWEYLTKYCGGHQTSFGWDFSGSTNGLELNRKLRSTGSYFRREKKDRIGPDGAVIPGVLNELPAMQPDTVYLDLEHPAVYESVQRALDAAKKEYAKALRSLDAATNRGLAQKDLKRFRAIAKDKENAVGVLSNEARKVVGQEKLKFVIEWIQDFLDGTDNGDGTGEKIIIFGYHRDINEAVAQRFNAPLIYGGQNDTVRQDAEDRFQDDPKCRVVVCQFQAAGLGINLTAATNIAFIELPYTPGEVDQCIGRAYGRVSHIHGVNVYFLIVDGTIEIHIMDDIIQDKRDEQKDSVSGA